MPYCANCGTQVAAISYAACPACGRATNGAARAVTAAGGDQGTKTAMIIVGVLVGGLVIVAVLGILAAIAIPNLLTAQHRSRQKRTMADIRAIAVAAETYRTTHDDYPATLDDLGDVPRRDGWDHALKYERTEAGYAIGSAGKDGLFEEDALHEYTEAETQNFNDDIVFANGKFVQYPEGVQR